MYNMFYYYNFGPERKWYSIGIILYQFNPNEISKNRGNKKCQDQN